MAETQPNETYSWRTKTAPNRLVALSTAACSLSADVGSSCFSAACLSNVSAFSGLFRYTGMFIIAKTAFLLLIDECSSSAMTPISPEWLPRPCRLGLRWPDTVYRLTRLCQANTGT